MALRRMLSPGYRRLHASPRFARPVPRSLWIPYLAGDKTPLLVSDASTTASQATAMTTMADAQGHQIAGASNGQANPHSWGSNAGAYDLRSDTMTTPTLSMLAAVRTCSVLDDVEREDPSTRGLEAHCAWLTGKEAGLLVSSGTMGNQVALKTLLTQPPQGVLCDHRSHIINYEAGGVAMLSGALTKAVMPRNGLHLTLEDVQAGVVLGDDVHSCPTRVISLEIPCNGLTMPLDELRRISALARSHGIWVHCDGARLWEAAAAGAGSLRGYAACCDTLTMCFTKGLGAPVGSILVADASLIKQARWIRKAIGGGIRQPGMIAAAARAAVDENFGRDPGGEGSWVLKETHVLTRQIANMWTHLGGKLECPVHTNMLWLDLADACTTEERVTELGKEAGLRVWGKRIVVHYGVLEQREDVLQRLEAVFRKIMERKGRTDSPQKEVL